MEVYAKVGIKNLTHTTELGDQVQIRWINRYTEEEKEIILQAPNEHNSSSSAQCDT